jgi:class 3 adenylate cyclase
MPSPAPSACRRVWRTRMTAERKLVTLLFADVVDSTGMGARNDGCTPGS